MVFTQRAFELLLRSDNGFNADDWVISLEAAVLGIVYNSPVALKYSEIGNMLGLNNTCISSVGRFKDVVIMLVCEDLVNKRLIRWGPVAPYVMRA